MQQVLARHDILFIADEVVTGLGRTGSMFATQEFDLSPDMITLAKGLSSAYLPISSVLVAHRVSDAIASGAPDIGRFEHVAFYNEVEGRIEIYIRSLANQEAWIGGTPIHFVKGELIHTEYSYKYSVPEFRALAAEAGFCPVHTWTDHAELFSVHYFRLR